MSWGERVANVGRLPCEEVEGIGGSDAISHGESEIHTHEGLVRQTERGLLVRFGKEELWVPKAVIVEVLDNEIDLAEWWAEQNL